MSISPTPGAPPRAQPLRVFVVDDDEAVRSGLCDLLGTNPATESAGDADGLLACLRRLGDQPVDVCVVDRQLGVDDGVDLCRQIRDAYPRIICVLLTGYSDDALLASALDAGAVGVVTKQARATEVIRSIIGLATDGHAGTGHGGP